VSETYPPRPNQSPRRSHWHLRLLLDQYNVALGWGQADLARALGRDMSWLSRIFTGKIKPHDNTLIEIAAVYNRYGLEEVTAQKLIEARDALTEPVDPYGIPLQWRRLMMSILALPADVQDAVYIQTSALVTTINHILARSLDKKQSIQSIPPEDPFPPDDSD
jgi:transcriptional regulator with XRE-family HTH domain